MPPIWKRNPPCKAHKTLESMFKNNQISADATPSSVQKLHPNFAPFSSAVFRGAFNELRKSYGTERKYKCKLNKFLLLCVQDILICFSCVFLSKII